jgi:urate oxidase
MNGFSGLGYFDYGNILYENFILLHRCLKFDNEQSSMEVFEITEDEAKVFFKKYDNICSGILNFYLLQWDAIPILSVLSK